MTDFVDLGELPPQAQKILGDGAPAAAKMMAAKGIIPGLKPKDILTVVAALSQGADPSVAKAADTTLGKLPAPILNGALDAELLAPVTLVLARHYSSDHAVIERLLRQPALSRAALELLAERADERAGELIATNEALMLQHPTAIEKLYMNERVRMSTADRLLELAVRNGLELDIPAFKEAALAIKDELIPEPSEEPSYDDVLFQQTAELAKQADIGEADTHDVDEEGKEYVRPEFLPLHARFAQMSVTQKIRRATLGTSAERLLLVRDSNRLVAQAVVKSPRMREHEATMISASRAVSDDVLRGIAMNREFTRSYQIKHNLIMNPRTPFTFASRLIPHLRESDLRKLAKSKNVAGAISQAVKQQLFRKEKR